MKLSIIIPVYNEKATLDELVARVEAADIGPVEKEIVIVDDGSTDGTREAVDRLASRHIVAHHERNKGKGAAIHTGLKLATGDYAVTQDADLEYDPRDLRRLMAVALEAGAPVVYGSRLLKGDGIERRRGKLPYFLGGVYLTLLTNALYGTGITDEPTGYKMVRTDIAKGLGLESEGFGFCPELTAKLARRRIPIAEVPISYLPRSAEEGKKIKWKDAVEATAILVKHRFKRP